VLLKLPIITLLSDFGVKDPYVAEMKAVVLSICPEATLVDISHEIEKFDVRMGAFVLASAAPHFPSGSVHVAVVDPGVGTSRRPIIIETKCSYYVGPDNGLLLLSARKEGIRRVYHITNRRYMLPKISRTFHGRDVFSCAAAYLAKGIFPSELGSEIHDYSVPKYAKPQLDGGKLFGGILYIDGFGNLITNISTGDLEKLGVREEQFLAVKLSDKTFKVRLCSAYGEVPVGSLLAVIGGSDFLELSVNQGSAAKKFAVKAGGAVQVLPIPER
jgi:S-adenosylmethionine hydrolase